MKSIFFNIIAVVFILLIEMFSANCLSPGNICNSNESSEIISVTDEHGSEQIIIRDDNSDKAEAEIIENNEENTIPQTEIEKQDTQPIATTEEMEGYENELPIIVNN